MRTTKDIQDAVAAGQPIFATVTIPQAGASEITPMQGGLPIMKEGKVVGAIGVGGSAPPQDEEITQAGIDEMSPGNGQAIWRVFAGCI